MTRCLPSYYHHTFPQNGTDQKEGVYDITLAENGCVVISASSGGDFMASGDTGSNSLSNDFTEAEPNFVAIKLDSEGEEVWRWQVRV